jgi:phosphopantothenoylcysteine decarboxylase/phosphopantothenate--cysteine ligase
MGGDENEIVLIRTNAAPERWPRMGKMAVARRLVTEIAAQLSGHSSEHG